MSLRPGRRARRGLDHRMLPRARDAERRAGGHEDLADLLRLEHRVERHHDGAGFEDGHAGQSPLRTVLALQADPVPGLTPSRSSSAVKEWWRGRLRRTSETLPGVPLSAEHERGSRRTAARRSPSAGEGVRTTGVGATVRGLFIGAEGWSAPRKRQNSAGDHQMGKAPRVCRRTRGRAPRRPAGRPRRGAGPDLGQHPRGPAVDAI